MKKIIFAFIILIAFFLMSCTHKNLILIGDNIKSDDNNDNITEDGGTAPVPVKTETITDPTAKKTETSAQIPSGVDYTITYTLKNTEGKYSDLALGPLIAAYNVMDFGADPTGVQDNTKIFQTLINKIGNLGGGTLYIPEGMYKIKSTLTVMKGVTIRGDWIKPDKNSPVEGTVLLAYVGRDKTPTGSPFIETEVGAGVMNLTIFYPEQDPNNIVKYSPAIRLGVDNYFGNEYNNVKNVTIINAYIGVLFSYTNGGAAPVVNGVYGSPLLVGVEIDNIADVGRVEWLDFSPDYWINCGLYERLGMENPFKNEDAVKSAKDFIYNNGTGLIMRRNDWSYACYLTVDGYKNGYMGAHSVGSMSGTPNGHNYDFYFTNCQTGVYIEATNSVGVLFNKIVTENCGTGIKIGPGTSGAAQFANCKLDNRGTSAIEIDQSSGTRLLLNESEINGSVGIYGGTFQATDVDFLMQTGGFNLNPHIYIGTAGRANIVGCRFKGDPNTNIMNDSFFASNIDYTPLDSKKAPEFPETKQLVKTPAKFNLYVATDPEFGAAVNNKNTDSTEAIQKALNKAAADGGGYVFLPAGKYRLDGYLVVPSGVELVGSMSNSSVPHGEGSILGCYYGQNDRNALPFTQLKENAGFRGITIDYPLQVYKKPEKSSDYRPDYYPYAIQGQGKNIYVINVGVRAAYAALDLFTYQCDNFYVDFLAGHMFNYGVRVGGNSENGILSNLMCNTIVYACGQESKFGSFANSPKSGVSNSPLYEYGMMNLDFLILGDCKNIRLYNCFNYGSYRGIMLQNDGGGGPESGASMGLALDGNTYSFYITEGVKTKNFDFINTQIVTLTNNYSPKDTSYIYSEGNNDFDITLFTSDYWGQPVYSVYLGENSGRLRLETAHFNNAGQSALLNAKGGGFILENGSVDSINKIVTDTSETFSFILISASIIKESFGIMSVHIWENNISNMMEFSAGGIIASSSLDRSNWTATASENKSKSSTKKAFDGKISTRWDTGKSQKPGQWFILDLGGEYAFNYLILDVGSSTGDAPAQWDIYVSSDGENWGKSVAGGKKGNGIIKFDRQTASYIKIEQNGSDGLYWSIHEMYVCNAP